MSHRLTPSLQERRICSDKVSKIEFGFPYGSLTNENIRDLVYGGNLSISKAEP